MSPLEQLEQLEKYLACRERNAEVVPLRSHLRGRERQLLTELRRDKPREN